MAAVTPKVDTITPNVATVTPKVTTVTSKVAIVTPQENCISMEAWDTVPPQVNTVPLHYCHPTGGFFPCQATILYYPLKGSLKETIESLTAVKPTPDPPPYL